MPKKRLDTIAYQIGIGGVTVQIVCPQGFQAIKAEHLRAVALWCTSRYLEDCIRKMKAMG